MSDAKPEQEPNMEEILASIRQIISEDAGGPRRGDAGPAPAEGTAAAAGADDVLELTEMMNDDGSTTDLAAAPPAKKPGATVRVTAGSVEKSVKTGVAEAAGAPARAAAPAAEGIVSAAAAGEVAGALGELSSAVSGARHVHLGEGDKTLEAVIKELLRPMLKAWLDDNLPPLVERLVEREIHRISGRADET